MLPRSLGGGNLCGFLSDPLFSVTFALSVSLATAGSSATSRSNVPASTRNLLFPWAVSLRGGSRVLVVLGEGPARSRLWKGDM